MKLGNFASGQGDSYFLPQSQGVSFSPATRFDNKFLSLVR